MADFKTAFDFMIEHEVLKGNVNKITRDAGGVTKFGISFNFLRELSVAEADFDHDGVVDEGDVMVMTFEQCAALYGKHFWQSIHGDEIVDQLVADKLLDMSVNMGVVQATHLAQRSVRSLDDVVKGQVSEDGHFGARTLAAVNAALPAKLLGALRAFSVAFYQQIATHRIVTVDEMRSWMKRAVA